jgi:hypothetical protein
MQTIVETPAYDSAAKDAGMTDEERRTIVDFVAANPEAGEIMPGCGGARKFRWKRLSKGKSGGYRIITYFGGDDIPVFLLTTFGKGEKSNLTKAERNALAALVKRLRDSYG